MSDKSEKGKAAAASAAPEKTKRTRSVFREYFELIAETAVFVFFVMTFVVQAFQIPTSSMEPNLLVGDFLLVNKLIYAQTASAVDRALLPRRDLRRQDIVVFKFPNDMSKDYVKRVVGLPGETVEIRNKVVFINGRPIEDRHAVHTDPAIMGRNQDPQLTGESRDNWGPYTVPAGHIFAMGDNRDNSYDSRYWKFLPLSYVKGRPWIIYFSYKAETDAYQKTSFGDRLKKILSFIPKARWGRLFKVIR
jgi:signal peptidase I